MTLSLLGSTFPPCQGLGERAESGLPDISETSTAIYTEGISPLDTWRSASSENTSMVDWQDANVSEKVNIAELLALIVCNA